ncbi:interleukin-3 receptor subunit alpha-like isoform X1 [Grammomys surdaster]|uniref:interleukin-3 receptor subunit alpha-like isoform X1 n=1 Tax=Grammomys surdaster TaxID=491861 RepID=UPI0010A05C3E|nr:interleukin-3 receptor subunit alpha-like isoform X1 [Grammomys surdaster]
MDSALWLLLGGVACTLTLEQAINIETTAPPIRNLRINPAQQMLTWELEGGASSSGMTFICHKDGRNARIDLDGQLQCSFQSVSLCHVTNYSVFPEKHEDMVASILFPTSDPNRGAAARDLHCWVHDVQRMTCRWGRGPAAPEDVRYRMFWRDAEEGPEQDRECPHYDLRERGANLGCVLDDVPLLENLMMVTVKGSSGAGAVSCSDTAVNLGFVEILTPPTLTAECNSSEAHVQWAMQSKFNTGFEYKLQYNQSSHPEPQEQPLNVPHFRLLNPGTVSFRVSATLVTGGKPSPWSNTQHLGEATPQVAMPLGVPAHDPSPSLPVPPMISFLCHTPSICHATTQPRLHESPPPSSCSSDDITFGFQPSPAHLLSLPCP